MKLHLTLALLLAVATVTSASHLRRAAPRNMAASEYFCDPATCQAPDCLCGSTSAPGGLQPANTPMMVTVTFDDALTSSAQQRIKASIFSADPDDGDAAALSANGCSPRTTYYVSAQYTDWALLHEVWQEGHEIATHTLTHKTNATVSQQRFYDEIAGTKAAISRLGQVPESHIGGFRAPFLEYSKNSMAALHELGMRYDSSIREGPVSGNGWGSLLSQGRGGKIFPYSMDGAMAQRCAWNVGSCQGPEWQFNGLWEVPMWTLDSSSNAIMGVMDMYDLDLLKDNFLAHYNGNRAPFGVFLHPSTEAGLATVAKFMRWAAKYDDVYFVSNNQLLDWMQNPVGVDQAGEAFACDLPTPHPASATCDTVTVCQYDNEYMQVCGPDCPEQPVHVAPSRWKELLCDLGPDSCFLDSGSSASCICPQGENATTCQVSAWSEWSICADDCTGTQSRNRSVVVPAGSEAPPCPALTQTRECPDEPCIDCQVSEWGSWSTCSDSCSSDDSDRQEIRHRSVEVVTQPSACPALNETRLCTPAPSCPAACVTSEWTSWGSCIQIAGECAFKQQRNRSVVTPAANGGAECGDLTELRACDEGGELTHDPACSKIDCVTSEWSAWGACKEKLGACSFHQERSRTVQTATANGGAECGALEEERSCEALGLSLDPSCIPDVACVVSAWSDWGSCAEASAVVGDSEANGNVQTRTRVVVTQPSGNGAACPALEESRSGAEYCGSDDGSGNANVGSATGIDNDDSGNGAGAAANQNGEGTAVGGVGDVGGSSTVFWIVVIVAAIIIMALVIAVVMMAMRSRRSSDDKHKRRRVATVDKDPEDALPPHDAAGRPPPVTVPGDGQYMQGQLSPALSPALMQQNAYAASPHLMAGQSTISIAGPGQAFGGSGPALRGVQAGMEEQPQQMQQGQSAKADAVVRPAQRSRTTGIVSPASGAQWQAMPGSMRHMQLAGRR